MPQFGFHYLESFISLFISAFTGIDNNINNKCHVLSTYSGSDTKLGPFHTFNIHNSLQDGHYSSPSKSWTKIKFREDKTPAWSTRQVDGRAGTAGSLVSPQPAPFVSSSSDAACPCSSFGEDRSVPNLPLPRSVISHMWLLSTWNVDSGTVEITL